MDTSSVVIGAILLALFIVPVVFLGRGKKKKIKQKMQILNSLAEENNCTITQSDFCGDFGIGIDESRGFVFFHKETNGKQWDKCVELIHFQSCKAVNASRMVSQNGGDYKVIDKLELVFAPKSKNTAEQKLELYNSDYSFQLQGELQILEKWTELINMKMRKN